MSDLVPKRRRRAKRRIYELGEFKMIGFSMANALAGDPTQPATEANRNTVGHGLAPGDAYTAVRALQTVLVLDQINRYVALPTQPAKRRRSR